MTDRPWLQPGAPVVIMNTNGWHSRICGTATIEKVGKRDVVLTSGRRFRVQDLHEQGRNRYHADQIADPADPRVREIRAEAKRQATENAARTAAEVWQRDRTEENALAAMPAIPETLPRAPPPTPAPRG